MRHTLPIAPQFYVTAPQPCPYLHGRQERKLFTALQGDDAQRLNDTLSQQGFRRSQNVLYRPSCADCSACLSARIDLSKFELSKSQKRVLKRNRDLTRKANSPWATEDQYELFRKYLNARHATGGMADMDVFEFAAMIEETPIRTRVVEYTIDNALAAVSLTDLIEDGRPSSIRSVKETAANALSIVYSTTRVRIGVSSIIAANSKTSMSAMPPVAWRAFRYLRKSSY